MGKEDFLRSQLDQVANLAVSRLATIEDQIATIDALRTRLAAADALVVAGKDAVKFLAKHVADTESVLAQRALDRMEDALRQYQETQ